MYRSFDVYGNFETPNLILCQPNGTEMQTMAHAMNIKITPRFGCYWDLEFDIPKSFISEGEVCHNPYYDLLVKYRQVKVQNYALFTIDEVELNREYITETKHIVCSSIESIISKTNLVAFEGVYKLFNPLDNSDTIMGLFLSTFDNEWKVACTDSSLWEVYRDYDISEMNWYDFLMNKVTDDFQCVFQFDTLTKTITIVSKDKAVTKTDIIISDENLLKSISISPDTEGIKTKLSVYGSDGISIMEVNPLGTSDIYNLDYYCDVNLKMLSSDTISAYNRWKATYNTQSAIYGNLTTSYKRKQDELLDLAVELADLQGELSTLESVLSTKLSGEDIGSLSNQIAAKKREITNKESQIKTKNNELTSIKNQKVAINKLVEFKKAFTTNQWSEVNAIIKNTSGTYINDAFVKTDSMTDSEVQEKCEQLFSLGQEVLTELSVPKYNFDCSVINFLTHKDFDVFAKQLKLGCEVTLLIDDKEFYPILLEMPIDFNDISNCDMVFSNNLRMVRDKYALADLLSGVGNTVTSNSINQGTWSDYINSGDKDRVNSLYYDAMDLANKKVISTTGQAPLIDHTGIRGRKLLDDGSFSPNQTWITNNGIYLTDSNWTQPAKIAIGEIDINGQSYYGIAGDLIIGNLMMTERLYISNENNTVTIDGNGITATDARLSLYRKDNKSGVIISPDDGICIKSMIDNKLQDVFYTDINGNLNFRGDLTGAKGTFSGVINGASFSGGSININDKFTVDELGNCVASNLTANSAKLGTCTITGSTFSSGSITGTSINIGSGNFSVDILGRVEAKNIHISGSSTFEGSIDVGNGIFTVSKLGKVSGSDIHISGESTFSGKINGGSIDIDTDAKIGDKITLTNKVGSGIYSNNRRMWGARDGILDGTMFSDFDISVEGGIYASGQITTEASLYAKSIIVADGSIFANENQKVATEQWVLGRIPTDSSIENLVDNAVRELDVVETTGQNIKMQYFSDHIEVNGGDGWKVLYFDN